MNIVQAYMNLVVALDNFFIPSIPVIFMIITWRRVHRAARWNHYSWLMQYYGLALLLLYVETYVNHLLFDDQLVLIYAVIGPLLVAGVHYLLCCAIGKHFSFTTLENPTNNDQ